MNSTNDSRAVPFTAVMGWALQKRRELAGLSQAETARRMGMTPSGWAKIEKGVVPIHVLQLEEFSQLVEARTSDIYRQVEQLVERVENDGREVFFERPPPRVSDSAGKFILGAALAGLLANLLMGGDD